MDLSEPMRRKEMSGKVEKIFGLSFIMRMEAADAFETSVTICQTKLHHVREGSNLPRSVVGGYQSFEENCCIPLQRRSSK